MALTGAEHAAVTARPRDARNRAAPVRRAANRRRVARTVVLTATDPAGLTYVLVLCPTKEPGRAYLLARDKKTQEWRCGCFAARWRQTCDHLEAIRLHEVNGAAA